MYLARTERDSAFGGNEEAGEEEDDGHGQRAVRHRVVEESGE
jgi:hypothetical protein